MSTASQIQIHVGRRVREIREGKGMSQALLATRSGLDPGAVCDVEKGKHASQITTLEKIAKALGVHLRQIVS